MPAALDLRTLSVLSPRTDSIANICSVNFDEQVSVDLQSLPSRRRGHWSDYPVSVLWTLAQRGVHPSGFDLTLSGNVPLGSGLSSSASVEVAVAVAVLAHSGTTLTKPEIAKICQFSENNFVGAQSGIMDPFTSCCGVDNHALLIDCRSLDYEALPLPSEVLLVICNSMVKHSAGRRRGIQRTACRGSGGSKDSSAALSGYQDPTRCDRGAIEALPKRNAGRNLSSLPTRGLGGRAGSCGGRGPAERRLSQIWPHHARRSHQHAG